MVGQDHSSIKST